MFVTLLDYLGLTKVTRGRLVLWAECRTGTQVSRPEGGRTEALTASSPQQGSWSRGSVSSGGVQAWVEILPERWN